MRNLIYTATLLLASCGPTPAYAATPTPVSVTPEQVTLCGAIGELAAVIMRGRQSGSSYATLYALAIKNEDASIRDLSIGMVETAFLIDRYQSERYRNEAVENFRNVWEEECIKVLAAGEPKKGYW